MNIKNNNTNNNQSTPLKYGYSFSLTASRSFDWPLPMKPVTIIHAFLGGSLSFLILCGVLLHADAVARCIADNLVVHIGDVHDVAHCVSALPEESA